MGQRTWMALGNVIDINHKAQHFLQPDPTTCWSAAVSIMLGTNMSVGSGGAMLDAPGSGKAGALSIPDPRLPRRPAGQLVQVCQLIWSELFGATNLHRAGVGGISRWRSVCYDGPIAGTDSDVTDTPRIRGCRHDRGRQCRVHDAARSRSAQGAEQWRRRLGHIRDHATRVSASDGMDLVQVRARTIDSAPRAASGGVLLAQLPRARRRCRGRGPSGFSTCRGESDLVAVMNATKVNSHLQPVAQRPAQSVRACRKTSRILHVPDAAARQTQLGR